MKNRDKWEESNIRVKNTGKQLSLSNTKRTIIIVILLMVLIPLFRYDLYSNQYLAYESIMDHMVQTVSTQDQSDGFNQMWSLF